VTTSSERAGGSRTLLHPRGVLLVALAAFTALAGAALVGVLPADEAVRHTLIGFASPGVLKVMRVINAAGDWRLLLPGTILLFIVFPQARLRWWIWAVLMIGAATGPDFMKWVIGRPRPEGTALGFPSGHATGAAAYFGALIYLAGALLPPTKTLVRVGAVIMIGLVAVARVMLRAHWPSDALGGIAFGLALAAAAALVAAAPRRA